MKNIVLVIISVVCISAAVSKGAVCTKESDQNTKSEKAHTQQRAKIYYSNSETIFKNKASAWGSGIFLDLPEKYLGWYITEMEEDTKKQPLKVKVRQAGIVLLALEKNRAQHYLIAEEWTKVGEFIIQWNVGKPYTFIIMEKYLEEGKYEFKAVGPSENALRHPLLLRGK